MNKKGFTLIEILVVIFIIGLLVTIVVAGVNYARQKARDGQRVSDLTTVAGALDKYYLDNSDSSGYPIGTDFDTLVSTLLGASPSYLEKTINNPTGTYQLKYDSDGTLYRLYFTPETIDATCFEDSGCTGHGNIYLIKNGKVSSQW